jgi:hypothetical protein
MGVPNLRKTGLSLGEISNFDWFIAKRTIYPLRDFAHAALTFKNCTWSHCNTGRFEHSKNTRTFGRN